MDYMSAMLMLEILVYITLSSAVVLYLTNLLFDFYKKYDDKLEKWKEEGK